MDEYVLNLILILKVHNKVYHQYLFILHYNFRLMLQYIIRVEYLHFFLFLQKYLQYFASIQKVIQITKILSIFGNKVNFLFCLIFILDCRILKLIVHQFCYHRFSKIFTNNFKRILSHIKTNLEVKDCQ